MAEKTADIIPMPGVRIQAAIGEPDTGIVELLETYLAKAKSGEMIGVAIAGVLWDGTEPRWYATSSGWQHVSGYNIAYVLECAVNRVLRRINDTVDHEGE